MYIEQLREMVPPPSQITVGVFNQITLLILSCSSSKLVTFLKIIDGPEQVSDTFILTVSSKFNNFSFQIFLLYFPEIALSILSYIVWMIHVALIWILQPLHFSLLPLIKKPKHSSSNHGVCNCNSCRPRLF